MRGPVCCPGPGRGRSQDTPADLLIGWRKRGPFLGGGREELEAQGEGGALQRDAGAAIRVWSFFVWARGFEFSLLEGAAKSHRIYTERHRNQNG